MIFLDSSYFFNKTLNFSQTNFYDHTIFTFKEQLFKTDSVCFNYSILSKDFLNLFAKLLTKSIFIFFIFSRNYKSQTSAENIFYFAQCFEPATILLAYLLAYCGGSC